MPVFLSPHAALLSPSSDRRKRVIGPWVFAQLWYQTEQPKGHDSFIENKRLPLRRISAGCVLHSRVYQEGSFRTGATRPPRPIFGTRHGLRPGCRKRIFSRLWRRSLSESVAQRIASASSWSDLIPSECPARGHCLHWLRRIGGDWIGTVFDTKLLHLV